MNENNFSISDEYKFEQDDESGQNHEYKAVNDDKKRKNQADKSNPEYEDIDDLVGQFHDDMEGLEEDYNSKQEYFEDQPQQDMSDLKVYNQDKDAIEEDQTGENEDDMFSYGNKKPGEYSQNLLINQLLSSKSKSKENEFATNQYNQPREKAKASRIAESNPITIEAVRNDYQSMPNNNQKQASSLNNNSSNSAFQKVPVELELYIDATKRKEKISKLEHNVIAYINIYLRANWRYK